MNLPGKEPGPSGTWPWAAALLALAFAAYLPVLGAGFVWDDDNHVTENATLTSAQGLRGIWLGLRENETCQYYPLTFTAFWAQYRLWGLNPLPYHLVNVLLHGLNAILLWRLLARWRLPGAWAAAAIFAVHPIHAMSVAWVTELKNVLAGAFMLLTLLAWEAWDRRRTAGLYALALLAYLAAVLSKTAAAALPVLMLLVAWWRKPRLEGRDARAVVPFLLLGLAMGAVTMWVEQRLVWGRGPGLELDYAQRAFLACRSFWFYAAKILWPAGLNFLYPKWTLDPGRAVAWLAPLALAALLAGLVAARRRLGRGPLVVALYFFLAAPALVLLHVLYMMRYTYVSDHWIYFGSPALIALVTAGAARALKDWRQEAAGLLVLVLALLGVLTWMRASAFRDEETLWRTTLARHPGAWLAANNLGILLGREGRYAEARVLFEDARRLEPAYAETLVNLGNIDDALRGPDAALAWFEKALAVDSNNPIAHFNAGFALERLGRREEALAHYRRTLEERPNTGPAHYNMGNTLARLGRLDEAEVHYRSAIEIDPLDALALSNLGSVLTRAGRHAEALEILRRAAVLRPDDGQVMFHLGQTLLRLQRTDEAVAALLASARALPDRPDAPRELALAWRARGDRARAESYLRESLRRDPEYRPAQNDLAWLLATGPDGNSARRQEALDLAERLYASGDPGPPDYLDTLAASYAGMGRFAEAKATALRALDLAQQDGNKEVANALRQRIEQYEKGQPWVEP
ncbi:MAG TPA: tetratricopeptide repeat protein [Kiritimatiellia bacterium]|nr:tetratricopeptide repeat protein [Kiritimatiellia bacterium]HRZ11586.1 tetratricopeptide repeat protein [Kiritimatiellia bacterium]HSA16863.1 tetratricopeptide repeat protein [Kiritimatiellia bacterium]